VTTVVITGANRGLGLELTRVFASRGDTVIAGCRNPDEATQLAAATPRVIALDVGDESSIASFAAAIGDEPVDVLINNAGIDARNLGASDADRDVLNQTSDQMLGQIKVNTVGPLLVARGLLASLRQSSNPRIVNVSSQVGSLAIAGTMGRDVGYAASKAALNMVTVKLAVRLRDDSITVIAIHPGHLKTDMGGAAAAMETSQGATAIATLIDGLTPDQSGQFLRWDGSTHPW